MTVREITPAPGPVCGRLRPPGSRSVTNRALVVAALAQGESVLEGVGLSEDTRVCAEALRTLGIAVAVDEACCRMTVSGCGGTVPPGPKELNTGESGTATRFVTALVAAGQGRYRIDGAPRMRERPIQDLLDGLAVLGVRARSEAGTGCPPVLVETSGLKGGTVSVSGAVSSQYLSALLMAAAAADGPVAIQVTGELVSKPFVDMTLAVMSAFGVDAERETYARFRIPAPAAYRARTYAVEPDAASASYFLAAAAATGGQVTVEGLTRASVQGAARFADLLRAMGCEVTWTDAGVTVAGPARLSGLRIDMNAMPDMVLTLAPLALLARGRTVIENVANLRVKESDRLSALAKELGRLGATVEEHPDGLSITPPKAVRPAEVATYHDHRIAMGMAVVGLAVPGVRIAGAECVGKTYPGFFEDLARLAGGGSRAAPDPPEPRS
ncbi:MAG: 3-phosphoshikimate 1-carboxyvinyltransferase [Planctomycetota bacterium]|nr:3-phosphoshikimate 1-carboxyvinyltransferase [Planctomycetota bacterium]